MGMARSIKLRPETVPYPYFMLFVIYNKKERAWHKGGMKEFTPSRYVDGAKMYQSYTYAEKVTMTICEEGQDINNFVILRYEARASEVIACGEKGKEHENDI